MIFQINMKFTKDFGGEYVQFGSHIKTEMKTIKTET